MAERLSDGRPITFSLSSCHSLRWTTWPLKRLVAQGGHCFFWMFHTRENCKCSFFFSSNSPWRASKGEVLSYFHALVYIRLSTNLYILSYIFMTMQNSLLLHCSRPGVAESESATVVSATVHVYTSDKYGSHSSTDCLIPQSSVIYRIDNHILKLISLLKDSHEINGECTKCFSFLCKAMNREGLLWLQLDRLFRLFHIYVLILEWEFRGM